MIGLKGPARAPKHEDAITSIRNAPPVLKTVGYVYRQCFGKGRNRTCATCSERDKCMAEA